MISVVLGILVGILAGLVPGIHTNLIAVLVASLQVDVQAACTFLVAVAIARSVIDAVPTVFLGAADSDVMALLPGHKLLKKGFGVEAVKFFVMGSVLGLVGCIALIPLLLIAFPLLFELLRPWLFWLLLTAVLILFWREGKWLAPLVFALAGVLGLIALDSIKEPLFPLLSGLFGVSGLVLSLAERTDIPVQYDADVLSLRKVPLAISIATGVLAGSLVTLFPGMGPSQAAALAQAKRMRSVRFLILVGAMGTVDVLISLVTFFTLGKARNGAVVIMEQLVGQISAQTLFSFVAIACVAGGVAALAAIGVSLWYARLVEEIDYAWISLGVIVLLAIMSVILSGWLGLLLLVTAAAVGMLAPLLNVSRSHAMGCLLLPTLLFLW